MTRTCNGDMPTETYAGDVVIACEMVQETVSGDKEMFEFGYDHP